MEKERDIRLSIRMTESLMNKANSEAEKIGLNTSDYIRLLIANAKVDINVNLKGNK